MLLYGRKGVSQDHSQKEDTKGQRLFGLQRLSGRAAGAADHCDVPSFVRISHTKKKKANDKLQLKIRMCDLSGNCLGLGSQDQESQNGLG